MIPLFRWLGALTIRKKALLAGVLGGAFLLAFFTQSSMPLTKYLNHKRPVVKTTVQPNHTSTPSTESTAQPITVTSPSTSDYSSGETQSTDSTQQPATDIQNGSNQSATNSAGTMMRSGTQIIKDKDNGPITPSNSKGSEDQDEDNHGNVVSQLLNALHVTN